MEGRVWRKVLPEGAWRRRWHWSAPSHSWPSCRCPEFPRQARVWPWPQAAPRQGGQCSRQPSLVLASGSSCLASPLRPGGGQPVSGSPSFGCSVSLLFSAPDATPLVPLLTSWLWFPLLTGWFPCSLVRSPCSLVGSPWPLVGTPWYWSSSWPPPSPPPHLACGQQRLSTTPARLSSQTWTLLRVSGLEVSNASHSQHTQHHSSVEQADSH